MNAELLTENMKAAIFDMDGTMVDSLPFFKIYWRRIGEVYFGDPSYRPPEYVDKRIRTTHFEKTCEFILEELSLGTTYEEFYKFSTDLMTEFYERDAKLKTGVTEYLEYLRKKGIKLAVASASSIEYVRYNLTRYGIDKYFDAVVSCVDVGASKEKPDVFLVAADMLSAKVSESCVFEDSFVALETAKAAGFLTVGIYDEGNYDHDRLEAASAVYIKSGETFLDLIV